MIKQCGCIHEYQDTKYGVQKRVHNEIKVKDAIVVRCTVCGKESKITK